jgi:glycosyltransferase involved in cell wall biosynthesis
MLDECLEYLEAKSNFKYEVIIVSDGSKDKTVDVALEYAKKYGSDKIRVLKLIQNRGKGGAVRLVRLFPSSFLFMSLEITEKILFCDRECNRAEVNICCSQMQMVRPSFLITIK